MMVVTGNFKCFYIVKKDYTNLDALLVVLFNCAIYGVYTLHFCGIELIIIIF